MRVLLFIAVPIASVLIARFIVARLFPCTLYFTHHWSKIDDHNRECTECDLQQFLDESCPFEAPTWIASPLPRIRR